MPPASQNNGPARSLLASILSAIEGTSNTQTQDLDRPLALRPAPAASDLQIAGEGGTAVGTLVNNGDNDSDDANGDSSTTSGDASPVILFPSDQPSGTDANAAVDTSEPAEQANESSQAESSPVETRSPLEVRRGFEQHKIHHVGFELSQGDTLVFVDFPSARTTDLRHSVDCSGIAYGDAKFVVHSENLLKTESPKFKEMLAPSYQFRVQRRRKLVNKLPEGIKYVLDMTPPVEGDDIVFQMTELSLTPGIINWWRSTLLHRVDISLVTGHDDICSCTIRRRSFATKVVPPASPQDSTPDSSQPAPTSPTNQNQGNLNSLISVEQMLRKKANNDNQLCETEEFRKIPDYCPFRHCCGIVRLMMMIEGHAIDLNSATKVWTLFALAKIWDCTYTVQPHIGGWLMADLNVKFIEVLPEEALEIGYALKLKDVTRAAFRVLVNELAIKEADHDHRSKWSKQVTVFGRRTGDLSDELKNIVEHAGRALVDRMTQLYAAVHNPDMFDFWDIAGWRRMRGLEQYLKCLPESKCVALAREALVELMVALPARITSIIEEAVDRHYLDNDSLLRGIDADRTSYVEPLDFDTMASILNQLNPIQRMLTSIPYMSLSAQLEHHLFWPNFGNKGEKQNSIIPDLVTRTESCLQSLFANEPQSNNPALLDDIFGRGQWHGLHNTLESPFISLDNMDTQIKEALRPNFQTVWLRHFPIPLNLTRHLLLNLHINELKYLPLWAGGFDDGSGGVFEDHLPDAHLGAIGPGPSYHTGITLPSDGSISESMMEEIRGMNVHGSTTAGSVDVHDSISTVYRPDKVIADDVSVGTEQFTDTSSEFARARFSVPAEHQATGQAIDCMVDAETDDSLSVTTEQIFAGDDSDDSTEKGSVGGGLDEDADYVMLE